MPWSARSSPSCSSSPRRSSCSGWSRRSRSALPSRRWRQPVRSPAVSTRSRTAGRCSARSSPRSIAIPSLGTQRTLLVDRRAPRAAVGLLAGRRALLVVVAAAGAGRRRAARRHQGGTGLLYEEESFDQFIQVTAASTDGRRVLPQRGRRRALRLAGDDVLTGGVVGRVRCAAAGCSTVRCVGRYPWQRGRHHCAGRSAATTLTPASTGSSSTRPSAGVGREFLGAWTTTEA